MKRQARSVKILVVHEVSYLKKVTYEFQILPEALSLLGHEVTVIDFDDTPTESGGRPVWDISGQHFSGLGRAYPDAAVALRHPGTIRVPALARVAGAILASREMASAMAGGRFDAMLLYGVPTVGVQAILLARRYKVPVFFRSIDVSHQLVRYPGLRSCTRWIERYVYTRSVAVSALTPRLKTYVASYGVPEERIAVLPAGVDAEMFSPGDRDDGLLARWGVSPGEPVILFMGTIYRFSGLDTVIRGFSRLRSDYPGVRLLVVGDGEDEPRLKMLAASTGVSENVIFTGRQPYEQLPGIIRSSDICINPFELNAVTRDILPTKLFQYLACGKPLVATELPGMMPFLEGERHGVVYARLDHFVETLSRLLEHPSRRFGLGAAAREAMEANYDWKRIAAEMASWIEGVI